jgi:hypothetical protein
MLWRGTPRRLYKAAFASSVTAGMLVVLVGCAGSPPQAESTPVAATSAPKAQFAELMGGCMTDFGWDVTVTNDLSIYPSDVENGIPSGQMDQYSEDLHSCLAKTGFDVPSDPTDSQLSALYEGEIDARECLIGEGYSIPEMPSEETFVSTYGTLDAWDVQSYITLPSQADYDKLYAACPLPAWSTDW